VFACLVSALEIGRDAGTAEPEEGKGREKGG